MFLSSREIERTKILGLTRNLEVLTGIDPIPSGVVVFCVRALKPNRGDLCFGPDTSS
jgi:hypothetical protein